MTPELKESQAKHPTIKIPNDQDTLVCWTVRILLYLFSRKQVTGERPMGPFQFEMAVTSWFVLFYCALHSVAITKYFIALTYEAIRMTFSVS